MCTGGSSLLLSAAALGVRGALERTAILPSRCVIECGYMTPISVTGSSDFKS